MDDPYALTGTTTSPLRALAALTNPDDPDTALAALSAAQNAGQDALLDQLRALAHQRDEANAAIRRLLAYARTPDLRPDDPNVYRLHELAAATGMTPSGVRTAYTSDDVNAARTATRPH